MSEEKVAAEVEVSDIGASGAIEMVSRAEVVMQMEFARKYPRSITTFKREALTLATEDEETAASCFYVLPRGGKKIEGPSVRLAEIVAHSWGHLRVNTRDLDEAEKVVRTQSVCWDMQSNVAVGVEAARRITSTDGRRYGDDMIAMAFAACRSVAFRNAIWKVVPFTFVKDIYEQAKLTSIGKAQTMDQRRDKIMAEYAKLPGVKPEDVFLIAGVKSVADLGADQLVGLRGVLTAIKDGESSLDAILAEARGRSTVVTGLSLAQIARGQTVSAENDAQEKGGESKKR